jgi:hypothetical protein
MGDKAYVDGRFTILFSVDKPTYAFLALDERPLDTYREFGMPSWLHEFAGTEFLIKCNDPLMAEAEIGFRVLVRKVSAGRVVLGPPCMDSNMSALYFSFFAYAD